MLNNLAPDRDVVMMPGPVDDLDHGSYNVAYGMKIGIDATRKTAAEGYAREWPPDMIMDADETGARSANAGANTGSTRVAGALHADDVVGARACGLRATLGNAVPRGSPGIVKVALFLKEIRVEHTLFALPFAYVGAVLAARGFPAWSSLVWITLAVIGRANRGNGGQPVSRSRHRRAKIRAPPGARSQAARCRRSSMLWAIAVGLLILLWAAWMLNPLCVKLMPIAGIGLLMLSAVQAIYVDDALRARSGRRARAPGRIHRHRRNGDVAGDLAFLAVTVWVAGFDIIYALMDFSVDRAQGIQSLPARFGERRDMRLPIALHVLMVVLLGGGRRCRRGGLDLLCGRPRGGGLGGLRRAPLRVAENAFVLNERVFISNMVFSVVFLATTVASYA